MSDDNTPSQPESVPPQSAKDFVDKLWELKEAWAPFVKELNDPLAVIKIMLLVMTGLYFQQWYYGGDDAPLPSDAQDWTEEQREAWKKSHPANHIGQNPLTVPPGYVDHNALFKALKDKVS